MPTRKQRRRALKERRHEYETVWVDEEGNELEEPPDDAPARGKRIDGKPAPKAQQRSGRAGRTPLPPSWPRAARRALILGVVIFALFLVLDSKKSGSDRYASALLISVLYTAIFIPFTYYVDRFSFRRWEKKSQAKKR